VPDDTEIGTLHELFGPVEYISQGFRGIDIGRHVDDPVG